MGKKLGLKHISAPQDLLLQAVRRIFPGHHIVEEYHIGDKLRIDVFLPSLGYGFEYHGEQHFKYIPHFHGEPQGFWAAQLRDASKVRICAESGIKLFVTSCKEKNTLEDPELIDKEIKKWMKLNPPNPKYKTPAMKLKDKYKRYKQKPKQPKGEKPQPGRNNLSPPTPEQTQWENNQKEKARELRKQQYQKAKQWKMKLKDSK